MQTLIQLSPSNLREVYNIHNIIKNYIILLHERHSTKLERVDLIIFTHLVEYYPY